MCAQGGTRIIAPRFEGVKSPPLFFFRPAINVLVTHLYLPADTPPKTDRRVNSPSNSALIYRTVHLPHAMVAQIEILALVQKLKSVRVVDRRFRRVGSHGLQDLVYDMQDLKS